MKFGPIPVEQAAGKILGHNIAGANGRRLFRKGHTITANDLPTLHTTGRSMVYVAELEAGDVDENTAASRIAAAVTGASLYPSRAATGRVNLKADVLGVLRVDAKRLRQLNSQLGITLATLPNHTAVPAGKMVGTVKIIPYAVPETAVAAVEQLAGERPLLQVDPLEAKSVAVILSGSPSAAERVQRSFDPPLRARLEMLGATLDCLIFVPLEDAADEETMADTIQQQEAASGADLIILAGETAIMDRYDIAPRAVERAGGKITCFGAPVDPGNLLMLAYLGDVPILGAPGCVRSPKRNIVDEVLPRLLVGDHLTQADIIELGHGGLLEDVPERPYPRSKL